jgi:hypothetical protein
MKPSGFRVRSYFPQPGVPSKVLGQTRQIGRLRQVGGEAEKQGASVLPATPGVDPGAPPGERGAVGECELSFVVNLENWLRKEVSQFPESPLALCQFLGSL